MAVKEHELAQKARTLRIRVVDKAKEGAPVVDVRMPIGVVKFGLKMAKAFAPQMKDVDLDWNVISELIEEGATGKLDDVDDEVEHKKVEVWVE